MIAFLIAQIFNQLKSHNSSRKFLKDVFMTVLLFSRLILVMLNLLIMNPFQTVQVLHQLRFLDLLEEYHQNALMNVHHFYQSFVSVKLSFWNQTVVLIVLIFNGWKLEKYLFKKSNLVRSLCIIHFILISFGNVIHFKIFLFHLI
jgi:hypothetical protein